MRIGRAGLKPRARPRAAAAMTAIPAAAMTSRRVSTGRLLLGWHGGPSKLATALQARNDQVQQAEAELRILEIQLLELIIVDPRRLHIGLAAHRHGAPAVGREQSDFAEQGALADGFVDFDDLALAGDDIERRG